MTSYLPRPSPALWIFYMVIFLALLLYGIRGGRGRIAYSILEKGKYSSIVILGFVLAGLFVVWLYTTGILVIAPTPIFTPFSPIYRADMWIMLSIMLAPLEVYILLMAWGKKKRERKEVQ